MKALSVKIIAILFTVSSVALAQMDPTDPANQTTNSIPTNTVYIPQHPVNGAIKTATMTEDVIEWWNFNNRVFEVEWRMALEDGWWVYVGEGYEAFAHQYPDGFYRVIEQTDKAVFPVVNSGTEDMSWSATTDCEWLSIHCVNTNIPPEWGAGYVIAELIGIPEIGATGTVVVAAGLVAQKITVFYRSSGF